MDAKVVRTLAEESRRIITAPYSVSLQVSFIFLDDLHVIGRVFVSSIALCAKLLLTQSQASILLSEFWPNSCSTDTNSLLAVSGHLTGGKAC